MEKKSLFSRKDWEDQVDRVPWLINIARITIVLSLLMFHLIAVNAEVSEVKKIMADTPFYMWTTVYAIVIIFSLFKPEWQQQESSDLPNASAVFDITMIMLFVYLAGGISTGFGILVLPFVATSCLLSYGRYPLLYASYTSALILVTMFMHGQLTLKFPTGEGHVIGSATMLIGAAYVVAILVSYSASYLKDATESAENHRRAFDRVRGLNQIVLQRVQEAVVVIDVEQRVWLFNKQAKVYFPGLMIERSETVFTELVTRWKYNPDKPFETDIHLYQHSMHVRAVPLIQEETQLLMLFVRSLREVAAEAMSTKLMSLGQLTANLAHEIRNPMSAIRHANDLLQEGIEDPMSVKLHGIIDSNIQRIDKMLEDVSMLNKKDNVSRENINLMKFWLSFKQEFTLNNPNAIGCIRMNMDGKNLSALADPMHVQQIMWNLCNNAWRHSRQDEKAITVLIRPSGKLHISIVVADNGSGVPPDVRNRLFEPFYTTEKTGTGLGLYVARELAHANMGQLHYHPEMNGFELILLRDENNDVQQPA